jgi:outer membrane receptor for Fe3+-dicitrate
MFLKLNYNLMKKIIFFFLLTAGISFSASSQQVISSAGTSNSNIAEFDNEIKFNFLNLIILSSFEVGYERFLSESHSLDLQLHINDRFGYNLEKDGNSYKTNSVQAALNFYFGDKDNGRFYAYPLLKFRFGEYEEAVDGGIKTTDMTSFIIGAGAGYKWEVSENFAFGPYASIARNFSSEVSDNFSGVEVNAGLSFGYRF